jgi:signal peptidase I
MVADTNPGYPPKRWIAVVLDIVIGGMGHAYVGKTRRALVLWLFLCVSAVVAIAGVAFSGSPLWLALLLPMVLNRVVFAIDVAQLAPATYEARRWYIIARDTAMFVALSVGLALLARTFVVEAFKIPAASMNPTLLVGDHMFVNKAAYRFRAPEPGEVAVFQFPENPEQDFVKRVIAVGGDRVRLRGGKLFINGWEVPRCRVGTTVIPKTGPTGAPSDQEGTLFVEFLHGHAYLVFLDRADSDEQGPYVVPDGEYFMMGDNRNQSYDSRLWNGGTGGGVPRALIKGPATVIWMSFDGAGSPVYDRIGSRLDRDVTLPASMASLRPALTKCLVEAPTASSTFAPVPSR